MALTMLASTIAPMARAVHTPARARTCATTSGRLSFLGSTRSVRLPHQSRKASQAVSVARMPLQIESRAITNPSEQASINVQGKHLEITDAINNYCVTKLEKVLSQFDIGVRKVDVRCSTVGGKKHLESHAPRRQKTEVTVHSKAGIIRAEVEEDNLYSSIDKVVDRVQRKLRKVKERHSERTARHKGKGKSPKEIAMVDSVDVDEEIVLDFEYGEVVREKFFVVDEQTPAQAAAQMDQLGHDFFVFRNKESGEINVLYQRKAGGYGVIIPTDMRPL